MIYDLIKRWAADPQGGGSFPGKRDQLLAHDPECASLKYAWTPRRGGSVCPSDLDVCDDCEVWFFVEGIGMYEIGSHDLLLCQCCAKKAGVA